MRIAHRPHLFSLLLALIFLPATFSFGQTPAKEPTGSISGNVTIGGKPAAGITVVATLNLSFFDNKTVAKATTDDGGNYKLAERLVRLRSSYLCCGEFGDGGAVFFHQFVTWSFDPIVEAVNYNRVLYGEIQKINIAYIQLRACR